MRDRISSIQRPFPINSPVKHVGKFPYFAFLFTLSAEIVGRRKNTCDEYGRVNGRQFALPRTASRLHVEEVVVEPFVSRRIRLRTLMAGMKKSKKRECSLDCQRS